MKSLDIPVIPAGDDILIQAQLKKENVPFTIEAGSTVEVRVVRRVDHGEAYTVAVAQSESSPGADWGNSLVTVIMSSAQTATIPITGIAELEIQITAPGGAKDSFFGDVYCTQSQIP